ncbi:MAG: signal peptidase I [Clostridiales bacterium]|nr:signal peptidase I [Clostridiales bacterium]
MENKSRKAKSAKKLIKAAFRALLILVICFLLGVSIYSNIEKNAGEQMPMPLGWGVSIVASGSMEPELSVNDLVIIKETQEIALGDTIVYETDSGSLVIHKVISIDGSTITTQGIANNTPDQPIDISAVKGKLVYSIPKVGAVITALKTPAGIIILLVAAVLLFAAPNFIKTKKDNSGEDPEKLKEEIKKLKDEQ